MIYKCRELRTIKTLSEVYELSAKAQSLRRYEKGEFERKSLSCM